MNRRAVLAEKVRELGPHLRRGFWQPLHRATQIFHVLPLTAALIVFFLLATDGQLREIYLSYLEDLKFYPDPAGLPAAGGTAWTTGFVAAAPGLVMAAVGLALIGAVLYAAHYWLSTMRISVIYSSNSNPGAGSRLPGLQRVAALALALVPWLGVVAGLWGAGSYLADRYRLLNGTKIDAAMLDRMQFLPVPSAWTIAVAVILLGLVMAVFLDVYRKTPLLRGAVVVILPPTALSLFLLLTYSVPTEPGGVIIIGSIIGSIIAAATVVYGFIYYQLHKMRPAFLYSHPLHPDTGIDLRRRRRVLLCVWALLPWLAIALYFAIAPSPGAGPQGGTPTVWFFSLLGVPLGPLPTVGRWAMIPVAMSWTITIGMIVAMLLDRFQESAALRWSTVIAVVVLMIAVLLTSFLDVDTLVSVYRWVGPLGSMALELLFLISTFALLAVLSQKSGFPALALFALAIIISVIFPIPLWITLAVLTVMCVIFAVMAFLSHLWAVGIVATLLVVPGAITLVQSWRVVAVELNPDPAQAKNAAPADPTQTKLIDRFECWLDQKGFPRAATAGCPGFASAVAPAGGDPSAAGKYPVFIVAIEGGGIYAASAGSLVLARLQDAIPNFSEHVFAISGVSGGSIGATIFQALDRPASKGATAVTPDSCRPRKGAASASPPTLTHKVSCIMQDDHFSPVVAAIFPEILGAPNGRADVLAASFEHSVRMEDGAAAKTLHAPFADHWPKDGRVPALLLNATWAETGFRAAFAPFRLHDIDESLYSFADPDMPAEICKDVAPAGHCASLMDAAVVSARFPGILPPYSLLIQQLPTDLRWNFVDGAYSDSSGAASALAVYDAIQDIAGLRNVDLRLILVTSSIPQPDVHKIDGTAFRDTLAPIDAILKVREGVGNEAVARVCDYFYGKHKKSQNAIKGAKPKDEVDKACIDHAGELDAKLKLVEIEDQTYGLPLGWKLSHSTFAVVSWMLGRIGPYDPAHCDVVKAAHDASPESSEPSDAGEQLNETSVERNSCVLSSIAELLGSHQSGKK
jgi:hypothetical protein